jgi:uncharacterized protein (DUF362 family)
VTQKPGSTLSPPRHALVAVGRSDQAAEALEEALADSNAMEALDEAVGGRERSACTAVIKPTLPPRVVRTDRPLTYAEPALVNALVDRLRSDGWREVGIGVLGPEGIDSAVAVGYRADALIDLVATTERFHYGGLIGEHDVASAWLHADARIVVGKARSDRQLFYAGAMLAVLGCVPDSSELAGRFAPPYEIAVCAAEILAKLPIAFGLVDALWSADGSGPPSRPGTARRTRSVIASSDLFALDWVLGELLGLDGPELSPVVAEALYRHGAVELTRRGDLESFEGWEGPGDIRVALASLGAGRFWGGLSGAKEVPWTAR